MALPSGPTGPMMPPGGGMPPGGAPMPPDPRGGGDQSISGEQAAQPQEKSAILREPPDIPEYRRLGVAALLKEIQLDKAYWEPDFAQMREDMNFARGWQWPDQAGWDDERYQANLVQRHVNQRVSALYAKNPTFIAERRKRMDYKIWDGSSQSLKAAMATTQQAQMMQQQAETVPGAAEAMAPQMPMLQEAMQQASALMADVQQGTTKRKMYENVGRTLEIVWNYYVDEQAVPFKPQMKQMVRRAITCGVSYVKLGFQRLMEKRPEITWGIADAGERMKHLEALVADLADDKMDENSAEMEELRKTLETLQSEPEVIVREGPVFDYPQSWAIIPDRRCRQLKEFIGCDRVTQEYMLTPLEIKETFGVDITGCYNGYAPSKVDRTKLEAMGIGCYNDGKPLACVFETYERKSGSVTMLVEGWPDYLRAPATPSPQLERFWPWFTLSFNDGEHHTKVFPVSDVRLLTPLQREYNRCREGLRRHRIANRPKTVAASGVLSEEDANTLKTHPDNAVIELQGMQPGQKVGELLQAYQGPVIDPNLYSTEQIFADLMRVVGDQQANLGGQDPTSTTATASSIAESSRLTSVQSNIDDLDDFLTDLGRAGGQVCLGEISRETAIKIAGDGAVWPVATKLEIAEEIFLKVEAGSSGRPNKAQEMQNLNMVMPYLLQMPGLDPAWLLRMVLNRMDDGLDVSDAIAEGIPSITALNQISQPQVAGQLPPEGSPQQQGPEGADNAPTPGPGAQGNATIPKTRPAVPVPGNVAARVSA